MLFDTGITSGSIISAELAKTTVGTIINVAKIKIPITEDTGDTGLTLGQEDPLEEEMTTYSNILA